ncbi:MAG: tetratricopeptide repeat protein [Fuerstiella sp.]|nr:tetratricopeptide repeat protein [Fuerstiella sp.]
MANDPYSACICGSGRKLKFCCQDILTDMQRIEQLRDNQPDVAEQHLRALYKSHPDKDVLVIELAGLVQERGEYQEARELCIEFLRRNRDEIRVVILLADLTMQTEGFDGARRLMHRAIQLAQPVHYEGIAMLLASVSNEVFRNGNPASAYAHLRRAIHFAPAKLRSSLLFLLSSWTKGIPHHFPLLGSLELFVADVGEDQRETEQKAIRLSNLGCWEPAAILYSRLTDAEPENGTLWYNLGLFHLWDNRMAQAAGALHRAATLLQDFDTCVEAEALAVLLDLEISDDRICTIQNSQQIRRPRELSSRLQEHRQFHFETPGSELHSTEHSDHHFRILADVPPADDGGREQLGVVVVTANLENESDRHMVSVSGPEATHQAAWDVVREAAENSLKEDDQLTEPVIESWVPSCCSDFDWNVHFDPTVPARNIRSAVDGRITSSIESWLQRPQSQLNDRSPQQAADDPELKVAAAASVVVLHALTQRQNHEIRMSDLREQLHIPAPASRLIDEDQTIEGIPLLHYWQLSLPDLTNVQLVQLANRIELIRDVELLEQVTDELFRRPEALEQYSPLRAHMMRALVARFQNRVDDMAKCFDAARKATMDDPDHFKSRLELDLKELSFRLDDPEDPGISPLLHSMRDQYFQKIPEVAEAVRQELTRTGCEQFLAEIETPVIVTTGHETQPQSSGKLWLPGQD